MLKNSIFVTKGDVNTYFDSVSYINVFLDSYLDTNSVKLRYFVKVNVSVTSIRWHILKGEGGSCDIALLDICQILDVISVISTKDGRYLVFQSHNGDGKIQSLIENTTVMVFVQKTYYGILVLFEKIYGNTVIEILVPPLCSSIYAHKAMYFATTTHT